VYSFFLSGAVRGWLGVVRDCNALGMRMHEDNLIIRMKNDEHWPQTFAEICYSIVK